MFALDDKASENPWPKPPQFSNPKPFASRTSSGVGDVVTIDGFIVQLLDARSDGATAMFKVAMYNGSSTNVSLDLGEDFVGKDADSYPGKLDRSDISTNFMAVEDDLVAGDTLTGTLTFQFQQAVARPARLHFTLGDKTATFTRK